MPRVRDGEPVVVIGIDSESLVKYGQWPWSREIIADLATRVLAGQPHVLGFDIVFAEPDRLSPAALAQHFPTLPKDTFTGLPGQDDRLAFANGRWLFDGLSIIPLLTPVFIILLSMNLIAADTWRRKAEAQLQQSREESARTKGEIDAARRIQMGLRPNPAHRFADERRFSVAALLEPALAIGGDYYGCFILDDRRLSLAIGDVSGKGIPASLFMAIAKTLAGTLARRHDDLGLTVRELQRELGRGNPEYQFVTTFIGILDANSGALEFVCAGHDAPLLLRGDEVTRIETGGVSGPPLCAETDYPYRSGHQKLVAGDVLCLFTDGVSEASDGLQMFGRERLAAALLAGGRETPTMTRVSAIRNAVLQFEAGQSPFDDLTLLLACWHGQPASEH